METYYIEKRKGFKTDRSIRVDQKKLCHRQRFPINMIYIFTFISSRPSACDGTVSVCVSVNSVCI